MRNLPTIRRDRTDQLIAIPFLVLLAVNTWHHALWSDELHAWGLVMASRNLMELFQNLHYEGHPGLWHLFLWFMGLLSRNATTIQIAHLIIAASIILIVAYQSPYTRIEKVLLLSNYFLVFEYTVLARNYGLAMLLALIYAKVRATMPERPILVGFLLGAMANTNVYGCVLAVFLALEYLWTGLIAAGWLARAGVLGTLSGAGTFSALLLLCMVTVWPQPDISNHPQQPMAGDPGALTRFGLQLLRTIVAPFFPVDFSFPISFAFPGNIYSAGLRVWVSLALLPLVCVALWTIFRDRPRFLLVLAGTALVAAGFAFAVYPSAIRHMGVVFVLFVTLLWIDRTTVPEPRSERLPERPAARAAVLGLLVLGALGGGLALVGQWMRPFSIDGAVVAWLEEHAPPDVVLVGFPDMRTEPIAILMHKRFYALDCRCEDSYVRFLDRRDGFTAAMIPERLEEALRLYRSKPLVLLAGAPLDDTVRAAVRARGIVLTERVHLEGAERDKEMTIFDVMPR